MAGPFKMKNHGLSASAKHRTPIQYTTDTDKSASEKQDIKDQAIISKASDKTKTGGKGAYDEDKKATVKAKRRQETRDSYKKSKKELSKEAGGSKIKNLFTSKEKLRSRANAARLRDIKTTEGQVMDTKTKDALGGDKYTDPS